MTCLVHTHNSGYQLFHYLTAAVVYSSTKLWPNDNCSYPDMCDCGLASYTAQVCAQCSDVIGQIHHVTRPEYHANGVESTRGQYLASFPLGSLPFSILIWDKMDKRTVEPSWVRARLPVILAHINKGKQNSAAGADTN